MVATRRRSDADSTTRTALLDAAQQVLLEHGYAAVTMRRVANQAGLNPALVHYYFGTMDELFIALFRRVAARITERQRAALASEQPVWGLWDSIYDRTDAILLTEFRALRRHRKAIQDEVAAHAREIRTMQIDAIAAAFAAQGVDTTRWPPAAIPVVLAAISRFLLVEESLGIDQAHRETIALVERQIEAIEGPRANRASAQPRRRSGRGEGRRR